jgi:tRNA threonylcarbamoyladenosine biosynthesis protein TsaB
VSFILNIDTAVQTASVCLAEKDHSLGFKFNPTQRDHAAWVHLAIKEILSESGIGINEVDAVAISAGPGSYTGLRVGMSAAKGLCYALKIPLITIGTLQLMAATAQPEPGILLCPMIDARRMEVFTAIFDASLKELRPATNLILDQHSFQDLLDTNKIVFFGNGSIKFQSLINHPNAVFKTIEATAENMIGLSCEKFIHGDFSDVAYTEPLYGKEFYTNNTRS